MDVRLLRADEIDARISSVAQWGVQLLLYKDARCDMNILDETVGPENWQRRHELINGNLFCSVGIKCGDEWVWKQDVGVESYTEKEKGQASDSFKRACFNWGIGRELYTAPAMFVYARDLNTLKESNGKWSCKDYFIVKEIQYEGKRICYVIVTNTKTGHDIAFGTPAAAKEAQSNLQTQLISHTKVEALAALCDQKGVKVQKLFERYGVKSLSELTEEQHAAAVRALEKS